VRFLGCTLWSDFALHGEDNVEASMAAAKRAMNDFALISLERGDPSWMPTLFLPAHARRLHLESRAWLEGELERADASDLPTVVVTHHAPHALSIHPRFAGDPVTPAFVSHLPELFERHRIDIWIHGHIHDSMAYEVAGARVICNPRGYGEENRGFRWDAVYEV